MDPQHRLMLECSWEALETVGDPDTFAGTIGVYAGMSKNTYFCRTSIRIGTALMRLTAIRLSGKRDYLTTRVSYKLNLTGPSECPYRLLYLPGGGLSCLPELTELPI